MTEINLRNIEYICLEGGNIKGHSYIGFLKELENQYLLKNIKGAVGTSRGAIFAVLVILGLNIDEIKTIIDKINIYVFNTCRKYFIRSLDIIECELRKIIERLYNPDITLKEFYDETSKELVLATYCLCNKFPIYLHHSNFPDIKLIDALISSITVSFRFKQRKYSFLKHVDNNIDTKIYPYWVFNEINSLYEGNFTKVGKKHKNPFTIGLKLLPIDQNNTYYIYKNKTDIFSFTTVSKYIINTFLSQYKLSSLSNKHLQYPEPILPYDILFFNFT